jgi:hypothetical protein
VVYATFTALDDSDSVKVTLDTEMGPIKDQTTNMVDETKFKTDMKIMVADLIEVNSDPFFYKILDTKGNQVYEGDALMYLNKTEHYFLTRNVIKTNAINGVPLFGLGARSGSAVLPKTTQGVYTFWNSKTNTESY